MSRKPIKLVSLAAALAALSGTTALLPPAAVAKSTDPSNAEGITNGHARDVRPNMFITVGKDLLGMIVRKNPDGMVIADHYSHSSHASHSSHYSGS